MGDSATTQEYFNVRIPFLLPLEFGIANNARICIDCTPFSGSNRYFLVEFPARNDLAFHMRVCFGFHNEHEIILNSRCGDIQSVEERHRNNIRLNNRQSFNIECKMHQFEIECKDEKIDFAHRLSPTSITALAIKGNIVIHKIVLENFDGTFPTEVAVSEKSTLPYQPDGIEFQLPSHSGRTAIGPCPTTRPPPIFPSR